MSLKSKGISAERDLVHKFWEKGWPCIRVAGSGSGSYPSPDLLAGNILRKLAIECKSCSGDAVYIRKEDIEALKSFAELFGAEAWVAAKFKGQKWFFMNLEDLKETDASYGLRLKDMENKGLSFEELIKG
jgi:holliday junction resolvase Hjr